MSFTTTNRRLTFVNISEGTELASKANSFGFACADYDHDGRLDMFVANSRDKWGNQLFHNETKNDHHWMGFRLKGTESNRSAIGSRVVLKAGDDLWLDEISAGGSWASQQSFTLHFGLGDHSKIDSAIIYWPNGAIEYFTEMVSDSTYSIVEGQSHIDPEEIPTKTSHEVKIIPNPFEKQTRIELQVLEKMEVEIQLLDLKGREVSLIFKGPLIEGIHGFDIFSANLDPGIYICRIIRAEDVMIHKIIKQ